MKVMHEEKLIALIKNGETQAYSALVNRYQTGLIIHCDNIVKDRDLAEDIAQEAFVRAYQALKSYNETKGAFSTWLYQIATNLAKDQLRRSHKKIDLAEIDMIPQELPVLTQSEKREIRDTVHALQPPEYARVIEAYFWEGKRYQTIAAELSVPVSTVGTWIKRAKAQLRKELS